MITLILLLTFVSAIVFVVLSIGVMLGLCAVAVLLPVIDFVVFIWLVFIIAKIVKAIRKGGE